MKILCHKGRLAIVASRYPGEWFGFHITVDYNEVIITLNVLTREITFEFVHSIRGKHRDWKKRHFGFAISRSQINDP